MEATNNTQTAEVPPQLLQLRSQLARADKGEGVNAYIIPSEDPHMSEYTPECWMRRQYMSKFTGSAGTAVVTSDAAALWTDGRYFLQASKELPSGWTLMRSGTAGCPEIEDWLAEVLPEGGRVGIDPFCHTIDNVRKLRRKLEDSGRTVVPLLDDGNLVDRAWGSARPSEPLNPLRVHPLQWAGQDISSKLQDIRAKMVASKADVLLVTSLDEVAWLFNLRGSDVAYNPVFISYAIVTSDSATLYIDKQKVTDAAAEQLRAADVEVKDYKALIGDVKQRAAAGATLWMDPAKVSFAIYQAAQDAVTSGSRGKKRSSPGGRELPAKPPKLKVVEAPSPVTAAKAVKNSAELAGMREAHLRDAVAICDFLNWLEKQVAAGEAVDEVVVDRELTARRAAQPGFVDLSFSTIAGADGNGAIIHYRAQPDTCAPVTRTTLLLLDSGAQYDCGTTDITRTMHFGEPSAHQRTCFTRVLQGHIALDQAVFPSNTPGLLLDSFARQALWRDGLDYRHGTGHGVGAALNVHEGPIGISARFHITAPLAPGMVVSNEPGYYEDGAFGIRVENLVTIQEADTQFRFGGQPFLKFDALTVVPLQTKMMDLDIMSPSEIKWVNDYHKKVFDAVSPRLKGETLEWLKAATQPIAKAQ